MNQVNTVGIDLAKEIFHVHGLDERGKLVLKKKFRRSQLMEFMTQLEPCLVGMEACGSAHYWARAFKEMGHEVKLMSPQFVKPYVKTNKNDFADAEAIAEAVTRPNMRFVAVKPIAHQDIQCVHRIRQRLVRSRTALSNEIRGLLSEYGVVIPKGIANLKKRIPALLEDNQNGLTPMFRSLVSGLLEELRVLEQEVRKYDLMIGQIFETHEVCQRIKKVEGIGPITATALVATMSDPGAFKNGREFSAYLGLVPRQHSTGGKPKLLGISKRGDCYLRTLLIHGARSVVRTAHTKDNARSRWIVEKQNTRGFNKAAVAVANKNARIVWALMRYAQEYKAA